MPIEVNETFDRGGDDRSVYREYLVTGTEVESAAKTAALNDAPASLDGYASRSSSARELASGPDVGGAFIVRVSWSSGSSSPPEETAGFTEYSFEVNPASYTVYQSRSTVGVYPNTASTKRFGGAINVDSDGNVQGVQWPPPAAQVFSQTVSLDPAVITQSYYRQLCVLAGSVNSEAFLGFPPGELIFLGASGSRQGAGLWRITYRFGFLPNETDVAVGDLTVLTKNGWDLLWVYYSQQEHFDGADVVAVVAKPESAYVERIAEYAEFSLLDPT